MNIEFIDSTHTYLVNGVIVPSVTQIMKPVSEAYYADIPSFVLNNAAGRGTRVHKAIYDYENGDETDDELLPYLRTYLTAKKLKGFEPIKQEFVLTDGTFCGTIDMLATMDKEQVLIDLKVTSKFNKELAEIQLAGYEELCEKNNIQVGRSYILHLTKDSYKLHKVTPNYDKWAELKKNYESM
jgi:hypothetical protein